MQDGLVWISFRDAGSTEVLVVFNEPEDSVTVADGSLTAIGQDDDCTFDIEVTSAIVSGHVRCADIDVSRNGEPAGTATVDLTFSANTDTTVEP